MPLAISRGEGQTVYCNGPVTIRVEQIGRSRVVLTFDAPQTTRIVRGELVPDDDDDPEDTPLLQRDDPDEQISDDEAQGAD